MIPSPALFGLDALQVWDTELAFRQLRSLGQADTKRTAERRLHGLAILPGALQAEGIHDEFGRKPTGAVLRWEVERARSQRKLVLFVQLDRLPSGVACLHANDARGARYWVPLAPAVDAAAVEAALARLQQFVGKDIAVFPHGQMVGLVRAIAAPERVGLSLLSYPPHLSLAMQTRRRASESIPYLKQLEAESIHILREAVAEADNPAMLYSVGKDSSVMLHLARKAFFPATPPFPLLHVDTRWKFREMYLHRDAMARESGMALLVHINPEAIDKDINPFDHGSALHTDITKTVALRQAVDAHRFDVLFGGARRDEEKSRAKERIFSFRTRMHRWDPKNQRPELWSLYNGRKSRGESIRVFPLANWTELDIWHYIHQEGIPVVPLYLAKERPVVMRDGLMLMVDDDRFRLLPCEEIQARRVRFRTLGCYPLTGAIDSDAASVPDVILELLRTRNSERQGRAIDTDATASMEKKKQDGYF